MSEIKPGKKYFTVVYEVHDTERFQAVTAAATGCMLSSPEAIANNGFDVTACGWGDYATERDALAWQLEKEGMNPEDVVREYLEAEEVDAEFRDIIG